MLGLGVATWLRLGAWMALGLVIYFVYGRKHSRVGHGHPPPPRRPRTSAGRSDTPGRIQSARKPRAAPYCHRHDCPGPPRPTPGRLFRRSVGSPRLARRGARALPAPRDPRTARPRGARAEGRPRGLARFRHRGPRARLRARAPPAPALPGPAHRARGPARRAPQDAVGARRPPLLAGPGPGALRAGPSPRPLAGARAPPQRAHRVQPQGERPRDGQPHRQGLLRPREVRRRPGQELGRSTGRHRRRPLR
ncbi:MAG TPA: amino acid permease C-terminal domain-containing protein [Archangium sp.]|nr:amino acid permease C-terminal domain-containing protein [Archangium sp.]